MRLLFIKLKHIGDSLLLTPTLTAARSNYPDAVLWVVVRQGCEGILAGCTAIDRLLTAAAPEAARRSRLNWWEDWQLIRELRRQRFDYAFELSDGDRGRWLAALSGAKVRCASGAGRRLNWWWRQQFNFISRFDWHERHRAEKDFHTVSDALRLKGEVPPLAFAPERTQPWARRAELFSYGVIHPGTRWKRKRWPKEKWIELGRHLLGRLPQLVISAGPDAEEIGLAQELRAALGANVFSTEGKLSWSQLAGLLDGARLFVGVDTAAMHLAAACGCPTLAIFGPSNVAEWRPWRVRHRIALAPRSQDNPSAGEPRAHDVEVADVIRCCDELLGSEGNPDQQTCGVNRV